MGVEEVRMAAAYASSKRLTSSARVGGCAVSNRLNQRIGDDLDALLLEVGLTIAA
jgi:hypothetical protein